MAIKKKKSKFKSIYIFPFLLSIICFAYIIRFLFFSIDSSIVEYGTMENTVSTQALLVRDEWVANLPQNVKVDYAVNEGERVSFGKKVLEINKDNNTDENLAVKIKELNDRITQMGQANIDNNFFSQDKEKINVNISNLALNIKRMAKSGDFVNLTQTKNDLAANLYEKSLINGSGSFFGKNVDQLIQEKNMLEEMFKKNVDIIYAQSAGIVSYELDGLEQVLCAANIKNFKVNDIKDIMTNLTNKKNSKKDPVQTGVKIVDNMNWYVCTIMSSKDLEGMKVGKVIKLRFKKLDDVLVEGSIISISQPTEDKFVVAIRIGENIKDFYKTRLTDVDIIKDYYDGFSVPEKCVVKQNGVDGIFILKRGMVRFAPVKVMMSDGKNVLINNVSVSETADNSDNVQVKVFDEVIITTGRVKDGQVIIGKM